MHIPLLAAFSCALLTISALPSTSSLDPSPRDLHALSTLDLSSLSHLSERSPEIQALAAQVRLYTRHINHKRNPYAFPKGGGGGKPPSNKKTGTPGQGGGGGTMPPGMSPDGVKAWNQCQQGMDAAGDCGAMKGAMAEMGCSLGSIHLTKPCENKEVQAALKKEYCAKNPKGKFCGGNPLASPPPTPPPKAAPPPPLPQTPSPLPSPPIDLSHLLCPEIYHPLSQLDTPPPFRPHLLPPTTPLPTLLSHGHFRPAATLAASLLSTPPLPSLPHDIFALLYVRLACLLLIHAAPLAAQEAAALSDLEAPRYRAPDGTHLAPWELRLLVLRLKGGRAELQGLCELAREARERAQGKGEEGRVWRERVRECGLRVAGAMGEGGDWAGAGRVLEGMRLGERDGEEEGLLRGRVALLYLKIGDLRRARALIGSAGENPATDAYTTMLKPLLSVAEGDYASAATQFAALRDAAPEAADPLVLQNLAVCLIYTGQAVEARRIMEGLVQGGQGFGALLFNLATVYELCSEKARGLKMGLAERVAGWEGRSVGWERGMGDFKL
ncbi:hypothetical protein MMC13_002399 [Lambiella insularis]|nr:hypothetical protein [Lambiella insularis]